MVVSFKDLHHSEESTSKVDKHVIPDVYVVLKLLVAPANASNMSRGT